MAQPRLQAANDRMQHRDFTDCDAMVLIGATALGFGWTRATYYYDWSALTAKAIIDPPMLVQALWPWCDLVVPCLTLLTVTVTLLSLRGPRGRMRKLVRHPGAVACGAVTAWVLVTIAFDLAFYLVVSSLPGGHGRWFYWLPDLLSDIEDDLSSYPRPRGEAVAVCWLILWMTGRWRAQATWLDRVGRLAGIVWIAISMPYYLFTLRVPGFNSMM